MLVFFQNHIPLNVSNVCNVGNVHIVGDVEMCLIVPTFLEDTPLYVGNVGNVDNVG